MKYLLSILLLASFFACQQNSHSTENTKDLVGKSMLEMPKSTPPVAEKISKTLLNLGESRIDHYYWLNERENPKVISFLEAENKFADSALAPVAGLRKRLFEEMKARIQEDDSSVPYFKNGFWYYSRVEKGKEYSIFCRKKGEMTAAEEILIDVNKVAEGHEYCSVPGFDVSPDNNLMFFTVDYSGRGLYKWFIKDLRTGQLLPETGDSGSSSSAWMNDSKAIIYDTKDAVTLRFDKIWKHSLGTSVKKDQLLFHEKDETQYAYLSKSKSDKYIFVNSAYTQIVEVHFLDADNPNGKFELVKKREKEFFYSLDHAGDQFYIKTNKDGAKNFKLMTAPTANPKVENWVDFLPHRTDVLLEYSELFKDFLVVGERKGGLNQLRILRWDKKTEHYLDFGEPTYEASVDMNPEFETKMLRYRFSSLKTPSTVVEYDMETKAKKVLKVSPVLGGFDTKNYQTEFAWATAKDGTKVPISMVYSSKMVKNGKNPCLLIGYGSYGSSYDPGFNRDAFSLVDRGFVVAIAHIRGGMEFGYQWYEDGKLLKKMNTFTDFIDCGDFLVKEKYTASDRFFASGRSAGGLLMGAVVNLRPDLFRGIMAGVPFVDVLTTMSDASIPLTTGEYSEWGNPANANEWAVMKSYSPYDNVSAKNYPNILVTTSLGDSQVQYFEPAKWVAKLREFKTDKNLLLLKTNMAGSHGGASGRFKRLDDRALEFGWMLGILGMGEEKVKN
jgi:oligopeptidase B